MAASTGSKLLRQSLTISAAFMPWTRSTLPSRTSPTAKALKPAMAGSLGSWLLTNRAPCKKFLWRRSIREGKFKSRCIHEDSAKLQANLPPLGSHRRRHRSGGRCRPGSRLLRGEKDRSAGERIKLRCHGRSDHYAERPDRSRRHRL